LADVALAAAGVAGEEWRAVEDDADTAAALLGRAYLREHVLQEEQRAVVDARQPGAEAAVVAESLGFVRDVLLLLFPLHAEGRIGEHIVEGALLALGVAVEAVLGEGVAEDDVVGVLAFDEHVGLADRPGFVVPVLPEQV